MEKESKKLNREELLREQAELARIIKESTEALNEAKKTADALQARKEKAKAEEKPPEAVEAEKPAEIAQSAETAKEEKPIIKEEEVEEDEFEKAKRRIQEQIEKTAEEESKKFDEKHGFINKETEKPTEKKVSIPFVITHDMKQQLADLGWSKEEREKLTREKAQKIITEQERFNLPIKPENKEEQTLQQYETKLKEAMKAGDTEKMEAIQNEIDEKFIKTKEEKAEPAKEPTPKEPAPEPAIKLEEKGLQIKLDDARNKYAREYKKFMAERKKGAGIFKKIFGGKVPEKEIPESLKKLEQEYDKTAVEYGKKMYADKEAELKNSKLSPEKQKAELARYKTNEIFTKIIVEEQSRLNALKAENLPPKEKGIIRKSLDWYLKQNRFTKIAISTALSTAIIASFSGGAIAAAGGIAAYAGTKLGRGIAGSIIGQGAAKAYDWIFKEKSAEKRKLEEKELQKLFAEQSFDTSLAKNKKEYAEILEREKRAKRQRLITKAAITLAAGGLASYGIGYEVGAGAGVPHDVPPEQILEEHPVEHPIVEQPPVEQPPVEHPIVEQPPVEEQPVEQPPAEQPTTEHPIQEPTFKTEEVEFSSRGAIQTIDNLKEQIHHDYPDISKAPASVQEFMNTDSTQEAIKLGFYNPDSPSESMFVLKGSTFSFDEHGNLSYHDIKTGEDHMLIGEQGDVEKYHGQMFDSDKSGIGTDIPPAEYTIEAEAPADQYAVPPQESPVGQEGNQYAVSSQESPVANVAGEEKLASDQVSSGENLTPEQMAEVKQTYDDNINHLFGDKTTFWDNVKDSHQVNLTADKMMHLRIYEGLNEDTKNLVSYLNKLHEVTGLDPIEGTLITPAETNSEFIKRALQKAAEMGQLDKVNL